MKYFKKISFLLCCILPLFLAGCTPIVTITAPANGDTFAVGETITFEGTATDPLHPNLEDAAFVWTSDKDGKIGTGASIESSDLSEGEHTITLTVKDPDGQIGQSSVTITVGNGNVPTTTTTTGNTPTTTPTTTTTIGNTPTTTTTIAATGTRFKDNGNGTVTDTRTGLIWLKNAKPYPEGGTWADAETYCASLASGQKGLTDGSTAGQWRLPSKTEFEGIGTDPPATWESGFPSVTWTMPGAPFTDVFSGNYWSGTSFASNTDYAWYVFMGNGEVNYDLKGYSMGTVWPVRDDN